MPIDGSTPSIDPNSPPPLMEVRNLFNHITVRDRLGGIRDTVKAVDGVSFAVGRGAAFGIVGETGSGKSTLARLITRLATPTGGEIIYEGKSIFNLKGKDLVAYRRNVQMVFQNPYGSLDPRQRVRDALREPILVNGLATPSKAADRVTELLELVGLSADQENRFPHELSGGQRQRLAIARALSMEPKTLVLDEPTSFLDVSIQAQILNLLTDLRERFKLTFVFISHNLSVIWYMCDSVAVMKQGKIIEQGSREDIFNHPNEEYTRGLIKSIPSV